MSHPRRKAEILHTSDIHVGLGYGFPAGRGPEAALRDLVLLARARRPAAVVIAGDLFDHNRLPDEIVDGALGLLSEASCPVIVLPGNHDPASADSVYRSRPIPENILVFESQSGSFIEIDGITFWGQAHETYHDFRPLGEQPAWPRESSAWRVAVAHGHFADCDYDRRFSYCIEANEIESTAADYVALGHWDVHQAVGSGQPAVYYSGSPCRTGRFALVTLAEAGVEVCEVEAER